MKNFFDVLNTVLKKEKYPLEQEIESCTNQYMLNLMLSSDLQLGIFGFELSKMNISNKAYFDLLYFAIPKCNKFIKYNGKKVKAEADILLLMKHFKCSRNIAKDYIQIISDKELTHLNEIYKETEITKMKVKETK